MWTYTVVDDIWQTIASWFARPGPEPDCSDSELFTLILVGECRGWDVETDLLRHWQAHRALFPCLPSQSRFNRRRRYLTEALSLVRRAVLRLLDLAEDRQCAIDSLPVPVRVPNGCFHLVPGSSATSEWKAAGATFGRVSTKQQTIVGYKLTLLVTLGGVILDFELAPANGSDLAVGAELLAEHTDLRAIADKAYISQEIATALWEERGIALLTVPRRNQKQRLPPQIARLFNRFRQIIETVNNQLGTQFAIETNHARTFVGLCARLHAKLAAHTLCVYLNRLLGNPEVLHIKELAFAN
ncbi:MAG: IS982 family transposase [Dehalococcoidia bacterium]